jgi:hypothetical protein
MTQFLKVGNRCERTLCQRNYVDGKWAHEKMLEVTGVLEMYNTQQPARAINCGKVRTGKGGASWVQQIGSIHLGNHALYWQGVNPQKPTFWLFAFISNIFGSVIIFKVIALFFQRQKTFVWFLFKLLEGHCTSFFVLRADPIHTQKTKSRMFSLICRL